MLKQLCIIQCNLFLGWNSLGWVVVTPL